jgi:hypothetical protein
MSSIGSLTQSFPSPSQRLQNELSSEVSAGTVSSSDQTALSDALKTIDSELKSQDSSSGGSGTTPSPRSGIKSKIDDLISSLVSSGKLTSDQANELKNVFAKTFSAGGQQGAAGSGGPAAPATDSSGSDSTGASDTQKVLSDFLKLLKDTSSTNSTYGANGQTAGENPSLLVNHQT